MIIVAIYSFIVLGAFAFYLRSFLKERKIQKRDAAADVIIKEDLLDHSIRNPFKASFLKIPKTKRVMLQVEMKSGKNKTDAVYDPSKGVYFGRGEKNQIRILDNTVSLIQGCIFIHNGNLFLKNMSTKRPMYIDQGAFSGFALQPGQTSAFSNGSKIIIGENALKINAFMFEHK